MALTVNYFLTKEPFKSLSSVQKLALILGAICHDIDHPGVNNAFLVNSSDKLAVLYNDKSVLEQHHTSLGFDLIQKSQILSKISNQNFKLFRSSFINVVLCTDFSKHFKITSKLQAIVNSEKSLFYLFIYFIFLYFLFFYFFILFSFFFNYFISRFHSH